jgi:hypothetical protein
MHGTNTGSPYSRSVAAGRQRKWRETAPFPYKILTSISQRMMLAPFVAAIGPCLDSRLRMIFRAPAFRVCRAGKLLRTFPDHALLIDGTITVPPRYIARAPSGLPGPPASSRKIDFMTVS